MSNKIESLSEFARTRRTLFKDRRHHPYFEKYWHDCIVVDSMSREQLLELRQSRLQDLVDHAVQHVPFYRRWAESSGYQIGDAIEYSTLPITVKADYIENIEDFQSEAFDVTKMVNTKTSGSSGQPFYLRSHKSKSDYGYCCLWRSFRRHGLRLGDRRAYIWGRRHQFGSNRLKTLKNDARVHFRNWLNNSISIDAYTVTHENVKHSVERINSFDPVYFHGYVTAIYAIALHVLEHGPLKAPSLRAVVTESEKLYDFQKEAMEKAFGCPVLEHYGSIEMGNVAAPDPDGNMRINEDVIYAERGEDNTLYMTNLFSHAFPFIRYTQGDLVAGYVEPAPGLPYASFKGIIGRSFDMLPTLRGGFINHAGLAQTVNPHLKYIQKYQLHQYSIEHIEVRLIPKGQFPESARKAIRKDIGDLMGADTRVEFKLLDEIPPAPSGKYRWVTSDVAGKKNESPDLQSPEDHSEQ